MAKYEFEFWDNGKRGLRYTILRSDGLAWICSKKAANGSSETEPVFIGPVGPREKNLGRKVAQEQWPLAIRSWIELRDAVQYKNVV